MIKKNSGGLQGLEFQDSLIDKLFLKVLFPEAIWCFTSNIETAHRN